MALKCRNTIDSPKIVVKHLWTLSPHELVGVWWEKNIRKKKQYKISEKWK